MTASNPDMQDPHITPDKEETLAERSSRLEAEAAMGNIGGTPKHDEASDNPANIKNNFIDALTLQTELAETKEQVLRALAEAENTRRRAQKEREDATKFAIGNFARDLLSVSDNLRRALEAVPADLQEDPRIKNLIEGIEATERELLRSFEKNGIQKTSPMGEIFNPNFHEVMFETPGTGKPAGSIIHVMETGYILNGRLLRPARVGVAKDEGQGNGSSGSTINTEA